MSVTDELRRMLDERGVEWSDSSDENVLHTTWGNMNCWFNEFHDGWMSWGMAMGGTPEQAIEATLGAGTCRNELDEGHFGCSMCGCHVRSLPFGSTYVSDGKRWYSTEKRTLNYCPHCGAKVVSE